MLRWLVHAAKFSRCDTREVDIRREEEISERLPLQRIHGVTRKIKRILMTKFKWMRQNAAESFARIFTGSKEWNDAYASGYDNAMKAAIKTIEEMKTE